MGIDTRAYTIYGIKHGWDDDFYHYYQEIVDPPEGEPSLREENLPFVLFDGMSGKHFFLGVKLFESMNFRWGDGDGDYEVCIDLHNLKRYEYEYHRHFNEHFKQFDYLLEKDFKLYTLIHYS